jgi:ferrochelatase
MAVDQSQGVLLTAHGSVEDLDSLPEFLTRIRHGRPAPPELVAEVRRRYAAIGGSPLLTVTQRQAALLSARLQMPVFVGMRLSRPELGEALANARASGVRRLCVLPLAPFSVHVYSEAAARALAEHPGAPIELLPVTPFGSAEELVRAHAQAIAPYLPAASDDSVALVLTAHSLPLSVIESGDRYQIEFEKSAAAIGEALGRPYHVAYQSQGFGGGAWLGPDLKVTLERLSGARRVVVAPLGFLADHVETLYDLDIEAKAWATELGIEFTRVPALNSAPGLVEALARVAERALFR